VEIMFNVFVSVKTSTLFMIQNPQIPKLGLSQVSLKCLRKTAMDTSLLQIEQMCLKPNCL